MRLSNEQRARAMGMLDARVDKTVVARQFGVHRSTISRLTEKVRQTNTVNDHPRAGRPRVTTLCQDCAMRLCT